MTETNNRKPRPYSVPLALGMALTAAILSLTSWGYNLEGIASIASVGILVALAMLEPVYVPSLVLGVVGSAVWAVNLHLSRIIPKTRAEIVALTVLYSILYWLAVRRRSIHPITVALLPILSLLGSLILAGIVVRPTFPPGYWAMPRELVMPFEMFFQLVEISISSILVAMVKWAVDRENAAARPDR